MTGPQAPWLWTCIVFLLLCWIAHGVTKALDGVVVSFCYIYRYNYMLVLESKAISNPAKCHYTR